MTGPQAKPRPLRATLRTVSMGLSTVLGVSRKGYFIPHRYADRLPPRRADGYPALRPLFDAAPHGEMLDRLAAHAAHLRAIGKDEPPAPRWNQGWFPPMDAAVAYAMVRRTAPARIIEIGSGHSTRFLARAIADGGLDTALTIVDPAPRAAILGLPLTHHASVLQDTDPGLFDTLGADDILFVDSSHILMPGTDVDLVLNDIWPRLPDGIVVHFHDVFLPSDYPPEWTWRGYNEQSGVAALLAAGGADILFASQFCTDVVLNGALPEPLASLPRLDGAVDTSLWLRKR